MFFVLGLRSAESKSKLSPHQEIGEPKFENDGPRKFPQNLLERVSACCESDLPFKKCMNDKDVKKRDKPKACRYSGTRTLRRYCAIAVRGIDYQSPVSSEDAQTGGEATNRSSEEQRRPQEISRAANEVQGNQTQPPPLEVRATLVRDAEVTVPDIPVATVVPTVDSRKWREIPFLAVTLLLVAAGLTFGVLFSRRSRESTRWWLTQAPTSSPTPPTSTMPPSTLSSTVP